MKMSIAFATLLSASHAISDLESKVVMVDWGTDNGQLSGQHKPAQFNGKPLTYYHTTNLVHSGTGLIARFKGKVGVLTNFHVVKSEDRADNMGKIHVNYTASNPNDSTSKMGLVDMVETGIELRPHAEKGGFFYTGGKAMSQYDWTFVGFDWEKFQKQHPEITPYDLTQTTLANTGDEVTIWHHGAMKPRRMIKMEVTPWTMLERLEYGSQQGKLTPKTEQDPNAIVQGSSGSPIFKSSDLKLVGLLWGGSTTMNVFVEIDSLLSQLNQQIK